MMQSITFTCEVITPMFLAGADGTTPELRPASIKGALRFWWRAMNGHLVDMRTEEAKIFGGTDEGMGRSKVVILPLNILSEKETKISGTPHHKNGYCNNSNQNCSFGNGNYCKKSNKVTAKYYLFEMKLRFDDNAISKENLIDLVKSTFTFGGLGKRERRGFGSIMIRKVDSLDIFSTLEEIKKFLATKKEVQSDINFASFKKVEIGKAFNSDVAVLEAIGLASHNNSSDWLGFAKGNNRFASPIYVSVIKDENNKFYPLVTTLNTEPKEKITTPNNQQNFIKALV